MSIARSESSSQHAQAVSNSLRLADEAAARGDYLDALSWLYALEAIGERLPVEYQRKHTAWWERKVMQQRHRPASEDIEDVSLVRQDCTDG